MITWSAITTSPTFSKRRQARRPGRSEITPLMSPCSGVELVRPAPAASPPPATATTPGAAGDLGFALQAGDGEDRHVAARHSPTSTRRELPRLQIAVARQRPEREEFRIAVIAQIEDARETAAGVMLLAPQPVRFLRALADRRCRAPPRDDRPRPPPSGPAAPRRSARRSRAPAHSPCSPACSCRSPRPSRHPGSGSRSASRRRGASSDRPASSPRAFKPASADQVP